MAISKVPVVAGTKTLTRGSIVSGNASGEPAALAIGSNGQVLKSDGTDAVWGTDAGGAALTGSTNNTVVTVTGANAIQGEANVTYADPKLMVANSGDSTFEIQSGNSSQCRLNFGDTDSSTIGQIRYTHSDNTMKFEVNGSEIIRIVSTGDVAIGATSSTHKLVVNDTTDFIPGASNVANTAPLNVRSSASSGNVGAISLGGNDNAAIYNTSGSNLGIQSYSYLDFFVSQTNDDKIGTKTQRMRIQGTDGKVMINTTSDLGNSQGILHVKGKSNNNIARFGAGTNGEGIVFVNPSDTQVGSITINSSSTSFDTSSDYRLKENAVAISDGITRLKTLKPYRFNFIADNDDDGNPTQTVDGFFAHEVTAVPEAISGEKNAMYPEVLYTDAVLYTAEDELPEGMNIGDIKSPADELPEGKNFGDVKEVAKPNYQGIDQSKLVPLLTSALQEAITKIETLEAKVIALENA